MAGLLESAILESLRTGAEGVGKSYIDQQKEKKKKEDENNLVNLAILMEQAKNNRLYKPEYFESPTGITKPRSELMAQEYMGAATGKIPYEMDRIEKDKWWENVDPEFLKGMYISGTFKGGEPKFKSLTESPEAKAKQGVENITEKEKAKREAGFVSPAEAGRLVLAKQAVTNIQKTKDLLFPSGSPESFRRDVAIKGNIPIFGSAPLSKEGQNFHRWMTNALAGKVLIQTGVAARPEEVEREYKAFVANMVSDPEAAFSALDELDKFNKEYINLVSGTEPKKTEIKSSIPMQSNIPTIGGDFNGAKVLNVERVK